MRSHHRPKGTSNKDLNDDLNQVVKMIQEYPMVSDRTDVPFSASKPNLEQELLTFILNDQASYPWSPDSEASDTFFAAAENAWAIEPTDDELASIDAHGQQFFEGLTQLWESAPQQHSNALQANLVSHFGDRIPSSFLETIAQQAQSLLKSGQPLADQLVHCVQDLLSGWSVDDLMVMARPYAYAMRGNDTDTLEAALRSVRYAAWTELSGVEQARLSLAIARYTLSQLSSEDIQ